MTSAPALVERYALALADGAQRCISLILQCRESHTRTKVHRLRVETRRLLAGLDLGGNLLKHRRPKQARRDLKATLAALGPLRDAQVQCRLLADLVQDQLGHKVLTRCLRQRKVRAGRKATSALAALRPRKTRRDIVATWQPTACGTKEDSRLRSAMHRAVAEARNQVWDRWPHSSADIAAFHGARVSLKRYRYQLEWLESLGAVIRPNCLPELRRHQQRLGDLHDSELLLVRVEKLAAKGKIPATLHRSLRPLLLRRVTRLRRACVTPPAANPGPLLTPSRGGGKVRIRPT